jgi:hypothetical protein
MEEELENKEVGGEAWLPGSPHKMEAWQECADDNISILFYKDMPRMESSAALRT